MKNIHNVRIEGKYLNRPDILNRALEFFFDIIKRRQYNEETRINLNDCEMVLQLVSKKDIEIKPLKPDSELSDEESNRLYEYLEQPLDI